MIQRRLGYYWMTLSFQSGVINSAGFVLFSIYLTHLTGIFSKIGLEAEQMNFSELAWWLFIPLVFLAGALLSTVWIEGQARTRDNPRYEWVFTLLAVAMMFLGTRHGITGPLPIWIVAFCAGAQNAVFNERTGAIMRTTHFTGNTTDLGISLARVVFKTAGSEPDHLRFERRLVSMRASSILCFVAGSIVGSLLALKFDYRAFWIAAAIYFGMAYDSTKVFKILRAKK